MSTSASGDCNEHFLQFSDIFGPNTIKKITSRLVDYDNNSYVQPYLLQTRVSGVDKLLPLTKSDGCLTFCSSIGWLGASVSVLAQERQDSLSLRVFLILPNDTLLWHKRLLTDIWSSHMHGYECVLSGWVLHQSLDFPLSSDLLVCGEVLLFWSSVLSRGVSSFGYGAAWQGIFRYVYFEVITLRCFCLSDSMLLRSFILCLYGSVCSTVQTGGHLWAVRPDVDLNVSLLVRHLICLLLVPFLSFTHILCFSLPGFLPAFPACLTGISPSTPSPRPLPVLFDINIVSGWPNGVGFRCGAVASSALLLPGYKQVSCGPWWPITIAHMLIEQSRQPCPPPPACLHCTPGSVGNGQ